MYRDLKEENRTYMKFYVYQLKIEGENNPFYIGKSFEGSKRLVEHFSEARSKGSKGKLMKSRKIQKAWKEGKRIIEEKIAIVSTEDMAHLLEIYLISKYGRRDNKTGTLCNHTDGGEGFVGQIFNKKTREKMAKAKIGNKINLGRKRPDMAERFNKPISMFTLDGNWIKSFLSMTTAQNELSVAKCNISDCCIGRYHTVTLPSGDVVRFKYGVITEKQQPIKRHQHAGLGKVQQFTKDGICVAEYRNSKEAEEKTGIAGVSIRNCIHGKAKTAGKFIWKLII